MGNSRVFFSVRCVDVVRVDYYGDCLFIFGM